ncbi:deoxyribose-phosphate aldolase isoform X2 [Frankliniella occidentalis]|uniref:Deoxyribose-phosphate aldolase n=1 Tax=Frankliniella occidentalis TaxID=133901 RepID=A0A9C6TX28_FRAOC|nr:deoxyribose-phosphate aldolase isoform X2 [Frankliniella occidentalis]
MGKKMMTSNPGNLGWLNSVHINTAAVYRRAANLQSRKAVKGPYQAAWLLRAVTCIDLTTLGGDDTESNVKRLCAKAAQPVSNDMLNALGFETGSIQTAAVCVYPAKVPIAYATLKKMGMEKKINVASVATGFPSGQYPLETRIAEIKWAVEKGANEIDIVIDRSLVINKMWSELYQEIKKMKEACGSAHLKTILAVGELGSFENVYKASLVAMMAGSDFIKTSTGKEAVNATIPVGIVMCRAIKEYWTKTGYQVGFKPAGGIRTASDSLSWLIMLKEELGNDWLKNSMFRFGASGLLGDIERQLHHHITGRYSSANQFSMG